MSDSTAPTPTDGAATTPTGRFCWHELLTNDLAAAAAFYGEVIGWGVGDWSEGETPYRLWLNNGLPVGGLMELPPHLAGAGVPPHWLLYVSTPDVDACAAKAKSLGGSVLEMVDVDQVGRMAVVKDPQGAVFIAHQPCDATPGHDEPAQLGEFSWREFGDHRLGGRLGLLLGAVRLAGGGPDGHGGGGYLPDVPSWRASSGRLLQPAPRDARVRLAELRAGAGTPSPRRRR